jgi:hypothetical protein
MKISQTNLPPSSKNQLVPFESPPSSSLITISIFLRSFLIKIVKKTQLLAILGTQIPCTKKIYPYLKASSNNALRKIKTIFKPSLKVRCLIGVNKRFKHSNCVQKRRLLLNARTHSSFPKQGMKIICVGVQHLEI